MPLPPGGCAATIFGPTMKDRGQFHAFVIAILRRRGFILSTLAAVGGNRGEKPSQRHPRADKLAPPRVHDNFL
jgi:hypothetical protein